MPTTYQVVRDKLRDMLLTVTSIQEVARYPKREFVGFPAAVLTPADGESDWETNTEDFRLYVFNVQIFYETKGLGADTTLDRLYNVVDEVLDKFAEDKNLTGITLPAKKTLITVNPVSAGWESIGDDELLMARIVIKVLISVDVT